MNFPERFSNLPAYAFPRLRALLDHHQPGGEVVHMTIGEPKHDFPGWVTDIIMENAADFRGYPPNEGSPELRVAITDWVGRRYGVSLDADANVMALEGWGKRAQRAMDNHLETYISFMALAVLTVYLGDRVGVDDIKRVALAGGWLYLISRVAHWLCFLAAVPYVRTAAYAGSILGIVIIGWGVFRLAPI